MHYQNYTIDKDTNEKTGGDIISFAIHHSIVVFLGIIKILRLIYPSIVNLRLQMYLYHD